MLHGEQMEFHCDADEAWHDEVQVMVEAQVWMLHTNSQSDSSSKIEKCSLRGGFETNDV